MFDLRRLRYFLSYNEPVLKKGIEYYKSGAVKSVKLFDRYPKKGFNVVAKVEGSDLYETRITFNGENDYESCHCSCPHYKRYENFCKHIAALYMYLSESGEFKKSFNYIAANDFLQGYFSNSIEEDRRGINIEYQLQPFPYRSHLFGNLSLKAGIDRLYVVKNLKQFLEQIEAREPVEFGKKFTFNPRIHDFAEEDRKVIDFLMELYSVEKAVKSESYYAQGNIFSGKNVKIDEVLLVKFLKLINGRSFSLQMEEETIENVTAEFEGQPFEVIVDNKDDSVIAEIKYKDDCIFFKDKDNIIYSDKKLYILDRNRKDYLFLKAAKGRDVDKLVFAGEHKSKFLSIIPGIIDKGNINISESITKSYVKTPLESQIYLDKYKKGISIKVEFKYGDTTIDPIHKYEISPYIIRDFEKEERILNLIDDGGFKVNETGIYIDNADKTYLFFRDIVPVLSNHSRIYYTDEVKDMYLGGLRSYRSYAHVSQSSGLIDINIDIDGIDKKEIKDILKSIKEKKKYHRFKNGKFLSLEGENAEGLSSLLEPLELEEIKNNVISLSKYRAVSVFQRLRDETKKNIENREEVDDIIENIKSYSSRDIEIPKRFNGVLRDYQITGYKWMKTLSELGFCGILADDMGLGKTIQAIALMYNENAHPSIVVSPSSLIYNWENEIRKFAPEIRTLVVSGNKRTREEMLQDVLNYDVIITSYPLLRRDIELYEGLEFKNCILDEAQHIKNPESINAQSVKRINAKNRFALTGTPMENSLIELWSIFDFLMPGYLLSRNKFSEKYERAISRDENKEILQELKKIIAPFILRRKKSDVLLELPEKIETKLVCELTEEQRGLYTAYLARTREEIQSIIEEEGIEKGHMQILAALMRLRQICCHPSVFIENYEGGSGKVDLLDELLDELIEGQHRILLFSQFTSLLQILQGLLKSKNIEYMYLDGSTPVKDRMNMVDSFNKGEGKVFLISLKAGGTGLNLTSADTVIHFDPWWNPAVEDQASDRAHRIGQKNIVQVFKIITRDTVEEKIYELQVKKRELINSVIQEGETFINKMSEEEILELLSM